VAGIDRLLAFGSSFEQLLAAKVELSMETRDEVEGWFGEDLGELRSHASHDPHITHDNTSLTR
jgi:hypothetical protein